MSEPTRMDLAPSAAARKKRAGRPQNPERGDAILSVTLDILSERGYAGLTVGEIVARARVSKSTIYRRWPTKEELAIAAFDRLPELQIVDRGDILEELLDLAEQYSQFLHQTPLGTVLPGLISEASRNPALAQQLNATVERRRQPSLAIVRRAIERGELPNDTDVSCASEIMMAPLVQRSFFAPDRITRDPFREIFAVIIAGLNRASPRTTPAP